MKPALTNLTMLKTAGRALLGGSLTLSLVSLGCATTGAVAGGSAVSASRAPSVELSEADLEVGYLCPMHPDHTSDVAGQCPICGMQLVLGKPWDMRDYRLDFTTTPAVPVAGQARQRSVEIGVRRRFGSPVCAGPAGSRVVRRRPLPEPDTFGCPMSDREDLEVEPVEIDLVARRP